MNFFDRQDQTRKHTHWLVVLFLLAIVAIVAATTLLVVLIFGQPMQPGTALFSSANLQRQAGLILATMVGVTLVMVLASLYRSVSLRGGGGTVARSLGGQRLDADTRDPQLRQLQNVVEELALAAGVPMPEIYVLEQEQGINAFAAGYTPADAAIGVTRGTLDKLDRAELQGVIAHEFSHILNGDMRLNIRLMGLVFGILVLAIVGQRILSGAYLFGGGRDRNNSAAAILAVGVGLLAIGYIGLFFGRWIKAAVARQRESLADASAVQFTRHPEGIAGALKKIAVYSDGALLETNTEEVSHMLFGEATTARMFATHPPIVERITAILPDFQAEELQTLAERIKRNAERDSRRDEAKREREQENSGSGNGPLDPRGWIERIGQMDGETLAAAALLSQQLPPSLLQAARGIESAPALIVYLLLDANNEVLSAQLASVRSRSGEAGVQQILHLMDTHGLVETSQRLALLDAALPALKQRSSKQLEAFDALVGELSEADQRISPFEFLLGQILRGYLRDASHPAQSGKTGSARLDKHSSDLAVSLAALAHAGDPANRHQAQVAYNAGIEVLRINVAPVWPDNPDWASKLRSALNNLDGLAPQAKKSLIGAWLTTVLHDNEAVTAEMELLRAFCHSIHVPMPPVTIN